MRRISSAARILPASRAHSPEEQPAGGVRASGLPVDAEHSLNLQYTYAAQFGLTFNVPTGQTNAAVTNNLELDRPARASKGR